MKLFHCFNSRSLRPLWCLEEMGLHYDLEVMPFPPRFEREGYLDINPLGTVPTFTDGSLIMTESTGICQYLVEQYGPTTLAVHKDEADYGDYLNWLYRSDATFTFPLALILRYTRLEPEERKSSQVVEDYTIWFHSRIRGLEAALQHREFLVGNRFTIADIAVGYALHFGKRLGLSERYKPNTARYLEALMSRPAFQKTQEIK
ncbi:MAG: glutathione S-transferase [Gammaproteobacteria bacterium]|nr:glutathione S-transferase [Gammaproteobacteria bacterium]HBW83308.1 glutathione S-transferase [Gammaproteobacteria bacterium]